MNRLDANRPGCYNVLKRVVEEKNLLKRDVNLVSYRLEGCRLSGFLSPMVDETKTVRKRLNISA